MVDPPIDDDVLNAFPFIVEEIAMLLLLLSDDCETIVFLDFDCKVYPYELLTARELLNFYIIASISI